MVAETFREQKTPAESDDEPISHDEFFRQDYRSFINATLILAANALDQCALMGDHNVAWEIKDDVSAGRHLVGRGKLSLENELPIINLVSALHSIPADVLHAETGRASNLRAMNDPSWVPVRELATATLQSLHLFSEQNARHLDLLPNAT